MVLTIATFDQFTYIDMVKHNFKNIQEWLLVFLIFMFQLKLNI